MEDFLQPPEGEGEELDLSTLPENVRKYLELNGALVDQSPEFYNSDKYYEMLREQVKLFNTPEVQDYLLPTVDEPQIR